MEYATIKVLDNANLPLAGAIVTYNGSNQTTDSSGVVTFERGETTSITVTYNDYPPVSIVGDAPCIDCEVNMRSLVEISAEELPAEEEGPIGE